MPRRRQIATITLRHATPAFSLEHFSARKAMLVKRSASFLEDLSAKADADQKGMDFFATYLN